MQTEAMEGLRAFCAANSITAQTDGEDILYINGNFAAIHAVTDGEKTARLDKTYRVTELLPENALPIETDTIHTVMQKGETKLFRLDAK